MEKNATLEKQVRTIGDTKRVLYVVVGYQDTDVTIFQFPYDKLDILNSDRVNTCEGLKLRKNCGRSIRTHDMSPTQETD